MRIMVCDDNELFLSAFKQKIEDYCAKKDWECQIGVFSDPKKILNESIKDVAQGGTWDGKNTGHLWYVDTQPTRLNLAITSSSTKTVAASLNRVNYLLPDTKIVGISLTGSNGQWTSSDYYVLNNTHAHYGKAYSASTGGATGRVSIQSAS